jgi:hypothetical protein
LLSSIPEKKTLQRNDLPPKRSPVIVPAFIMVEQTSRRSVGRKRNDYIDGLTIR